MRTFAAALLFVGTLGVSLTSLLTDQGQDPVTGGQVTGGSGGPVDQSNSASLSGGQANAGSSAGQGGSGANGTSDTDLGVL